MSYKFSYLLTTDSPPTLEAELLKSNFHTSNHLFSLTFRTAVHGMKTTFRLKWRLGLVPEIYRAFIWNLEDENAAIESITDKSDNQQLLT